MHKCPDICALGFLAIPLCLSPFFARDMAEMKAKVYKFSALAQLYRTFLNTAVFSDIYNAFLGLDDFEYL